MNNEVKPIYDEFGRVIDFEVLPLKEEMNLTKLQREGNSNCNPVLCCAKYPDCENYCENIVPKGKRIYFVDDKKRTSSNLTTLKLLEGNILCPIAGVSCAGYKDNNLVEKRCAGLHNGCGVYSNIIGIKFEGRELKILKNKILCPDAGTRCAAFKDINLLEELCAGRHKDCGGYFLNHKGEYKE